MNPKVLAAARELVERATADGQTGAVATADELARLQGDIGSRLPTWYRDLLSAVPLIGLELGVATLQSDDEDEISWLLWLGPESIRTESTELFPGSAVLDRGYLCVGGCAHGTGDQYFLATNAGDDPPLVQIYHDVGTDPDAILAEGVVEIAPSLSAFFARAKTR